jgi:hypothetical protein
MSSLEVRPTTRDPSTDSPTLEDGTNGAVFEIGTDSEEKWTAVSISSDHEAEKENVPPGRLMRAKMGSIEKRQRARKSDGVGKTRQFFRAVQSAFQRTSKGERTMVTEKAASTGSLDQSGDSSATEISEQNSIFLAPMQRVQSANPFDDVN